MKKIKLLLSVSLLLFCNQLMAQVEFDGTTTISAPTTSSAIGNNTTASGIGSFAGGNLSDAFGDYSFAFGDEVRIGSSGSFNSHFSFGFGNGLTIDATHAIVFGNGLTIDNNTSNLDNSFIVGFGGTPMFFVQNEKVGINTTTPQYELDVQGSVAISDILYLNGKLIDGIGSAGNQGDVLYRSTQNDYTEWRSLANIGNGRWTIDGVNIYSTLTGNVGIGTGITTPDAKLEVSDHQSVLNNKIAKFKDSENRQIFFVPKLTQTGYDNVMCQLNDIGIIFSDGQTTGSGYNMDAGFVIGPYSEGVKGIRIDKYGRVGIGTTTVGSENESCADGTSLQVNGGTALGYNTPTEVPADGLLVNGVVGINTNTTDISTLPSACKLAVNGTIYATEMRVQEYTNWPDYVFANNYNLMPLSELEKYIKKHSHLPDVPSKDKVSEDGINVGEMNEILLKKIEELTLYIIELKKENIEINRKMDLFYQCNN